MSEDWPLLRNVLVFAGAAAVTIVGAIRLSGLADELADRTGFGEATFGAIFFGGMISLSGIVMTATAAARGEPSLAYGNAVGGIAAQTAALAVADLFYRKANLEHAAASLTNMVHGTLLVAMLTIAAMGSAVPPWTLFGIHPASPLLLGTYALGLRFAQSSQAHPGWLPLRTRTTVVDEPETGAGSSRTTGRLWFEFLAIGAVVSFGGWAIARTAGAITVQTGLSASFVGTVLMGLVNAIPETVTSVAAVRRGALSLAVGGILGGNAFDALNLVVGDVFYREGSLYHAAAPSERFVTLAALLMTATVLAGLLRRESRGAGGIGTEGLLLLLIYGATVAVVALGF